MRIVQLAAEFSPIAKAGGLGEVLLGLTRELLRSGHDVDVIIPKYDFISSLPMKMEVADFKCLNYNNAMWNAQVEGCPIHLLEARHPAGYFHRSAIYGCEDDVPRFLYFARAALEYLGLKNRPIDVLHLHDWHVSIAALMVKTIFKSLKIGKVVLTLHNVEYQGKCAAHDLEAIGLTEWEGFQGSDPKYPETINLLKGGIIYADALVPVSPTYGEEIQTAKGGFGLQSTLKAMKGKIHSVLNGIDEKAWDPKSDPYLPLCYSLESQRTGKGKARSLFPLDQKKRPWVGAVTRIAAQKGPELLEAALEEVIRLGGNFLLLGSSSDPKLQAHFNALKARFQGHPQVFLQYEYTEQMAHRIYAALDYLLVPSHFEPCGLTQLIGMRYGTVPIVRATGGLKDTVFDCEDPRFTIEQRNGFSFPNATIPSLKETLARAFQLFYREPATFQSLIRRGMQSDFSWKKPAQKYVRIYELKSFSNIGPIGVEVIEDRKGRVNGRGHHRKQTDLLEQME